MEALANSAVTSFGLADCNNFYATCETVFCPKLAGKPLIVLSNNDGNVIARSREAKTLGIPMGAPVHTLKQVIAQQGVTVCSANFALYGDLSQRVMDVLARFTPRLDCYSIDEAFLDLSATCAPAERLWYAQHIRETVHRWTGIWVSIGIAPTKTLAKAANDAAKHLPNGALSLETPDQIDALLAGMAVEDVWGIGKQRGVYLRQHKLATALDLQQADAAWVKRHLYVPVARTQWELRGVSCLPLTTTCAAHQQIMSSRSFGGPVTTLDELKEALAFHITRAAEKLRSQRSLAQVATISITTNRFRQHTPQYSRSATIRLTRPTASTSELLGAALAAVERIYRPGYSYHKAGILLADFVSDAITQQELFAPPADERQQEVMRIMDAINARFGRDTIHLAALGADKSRKVAPAWQMRQAHLSPQYTTRWEALAHVI